MVVPAGLRTEYSETSPALQSAISSMGPLPPGVQMSSLVSGPHVQNSAHFAGRAMDLGAPDIQSAMQMTARAIRSGRFAKIGSTQSVIVNPQLQGMARAAGVELFDDEGTGLHVHLEVGP